MASLLDLDRASYTVPSPPLTTPAPIFHGIDLRQEPTTTQSDCDGRGIMHCGGQYGYCYGGTDGFIGCCQTTSCAARTTCIPYSEISTRSCDFNTGGCVPCTNPAAPDCFTLTNPEAGIYAMYCTVAGSGGIDTSNYVALASPTSVAAGPQMIFGGPSDMPLSSPLIVSSSEPSRSTPLSPSSSQEPSQAAVTSTSHIPTPSSSSPITMSTAPTTSTKTVSVKITSSNGEGGPARLSTGAIAGIAVGAAVVGSIIILILIFLILKRRKQKRQEILTAQSSNFYKEVANDDPTHWQRAAGGGGGGGKAGGRQPQHVYEADPAYAVRYSELPDTPASMFQKEWFSSFHENGSDAPAAASDGPDMNSNINTARPSTDEPLGRYHDGVES